MEKVKMVTDDKVLLQNYIEINKWDFDFENQKTKSDCEQSFLSRMIFKELFEKMLDGNYKYYLDDKIATYINKEDKEKSFLFDVMYNPKESHQPFNNVKKLSKENNVTFRDIYHSIGNFAPISRTISTH